MSVLDRLRDRIRAGRRRGGSGPEGVAVHVRPHNVPAARRSGRLLPGALWWGLLLAVAFYAGAHLAVVAGVWPVHGTAPGAGGLLVRDALTLLAWIAALFAFRALGYRGRWALLVLPVVIFSLTRPSLFHTFTDPAYQAPSARRAEANQLKATRARLSTIERAYSDERKELVFAGPAPEIPDPFREPEARSRGLLARVASQFSVLVAPLALLFGFLLARSGARWRWLREHRLWIFAPVLAVFLVLTVGFTNRVTGKVGGTTPWELFLPVFVALWAATLADDAYNLARPGAVAEPRRLANLFLYGAVPLVPFVMIGDLGLSIVLAGSLAAMLLVATRRAWWAAALGAVWIVMVVLAFQVEATAQTRLGLAYEPYRDLSAMPEAEGQRWADRLFQIKLFDANVLAGGVVGEGAGRGHAETAPNAADDGFATLFAANWGWLGSLALVLLYALFLVEMLAVAAREKGAFERTLATGVAMLIGIPFWLAFLGGVRVVPLTGVAAAFAASGGAKLLASALAVGLVAGIADRRARSERLDGALAAPAGAALDDEGVRVR